MKSTSETGASVRWLNQTVDAQAAREHVQQGKQCVRMAMTWSDKWSFVVTEQFIIKKIKANDIFDENLQEPEAQDIDRSEEHTSELQSLMRISYAVFCLKKKTYKSK